MGDRPSQGPGSQGGGRRRVASAGFLAAASQHQAFVGPAARPTRLHVGVQKASRPLAAVHDSASHRSNTSGESSMRVKDGCQLALGLVAGASVLSDRNGAARNLSGRSRKERSNLQQGKEHADFAHALQLKEQAASLRAEVALSEEALASDRHARLRAAFHHWLSASGSHVLHPKEFLQGAADVSSLTMTHAEAAALVNLYDADRDGGLSFEEFADALTCLDEDLTRLREEQQQTRQAAAHDGGNSHGLLPEAHDVEVPSMPQEVMDTQLGTRILAMCAFLLPLADGFRTMAPTEMEAVVGKPMMDGMAVLQPILLLSMCRWACKWTLPQLLRFSVYQAFTMSLLVCIASVVVTPTGWLSLAGMGVGSPETMEQLSFLCLALVSCAVGYSWVSVSIGELPDKLPVVSPAARASLGSVHKPNRAANAVSMEQEHRSKCSSGGNHGGLNGTVLHFLGCLAVSFVYLMALMGYLAIIATVSAGLDQEGFEEALKSAVLF